MNTREEECKLVVRNFYEGFNTRDLPAVFDKYLCDYLINHSGLDKQSWLHYDMATMSALPDLKLTISEQVAEENKVFTHWSCTGTHTENFFDKPATGNLVRLDGISIDIIVNGRIVEHSVFADFTEFINQFNGK